MNEHNVEDNWKGLRRKAVDHRGKHTNDRLDEIAAKRDQLEREIRQVHRIVKDAVEKQVG